VTTEEADEATDLVVMVVAEGRGCGWCGAHRCGGGLDGQGQRAGKEGEAAEEKREP